MKKHKIDWLNMPGFKGETWNPFVGCTKVSPACKNCYAERMAFRINNMHPGTGYNKVISGKKWNGQTHFIEPALDKPLHWRDPRMIFVCSMSDLFHENNSFENIDKIFGLFSQTPQHKYILLTKRPKQALEYFKWFGGQIKEMGFDSIPSQSEEPLDYYKPLENVWIGATVEELKYTPRIDDLLKIPAVVHFVSIEPMLSGMDISDYLHDSNCNEVRHEAGCICSEPREICLDWVICGGESGHNARSMNLDWVRSIKDQCEMAKVPFFFKQLSQADFKSFKDRDCFPLDLRINEFPI